MRGRALSCSKRKLLLADLVGQSLQLSAVDLGSNCRVVRQQFETVDSMSSLPDAHHDLLRMDFTFHERIRHFIASAPRTFVGVVDVEGPFFISSDNGVQPDESAASGEQLSADIEASLAVAVAQCMWEPLTELFHHSERSHSIAYGEQPRLTANTAHFHMDAAPPDSPVRQTTLQSVDQSEAHLRVSCFRL